MIYEAWWKELGQGSSGVMPINLAKAHLTQIKKKPSKIQSLRYRMETKSVRSNGSKEALEKKYLTSLVHTLFWARIIYRAFVFHDDWKPINLLCFFLDAIFWSLFPFFVAACNSNKNFFFFHSLRVSGDPFSSLFCSIFGVSVAGSRDSWGDYSRSVFQRVSTRSCNLLLLRL